MNRNIKSLIDYTMSARNGEIGKVEDFYFDDDNWKIRYLIVKTGTWLFGRKVLISPLALVNASWETGSFPVNLTKEQVRQSPDIDTDKPVNLQQEIELHNHYPWQNYWGGGLYAYGVMGIENFEPGIDVEIAMDKTERPRNDLHLRSTNKITGYPIQAIDGEIGHVVDLIMDDQSWQLLFLVVNTHHWLGGKKVLIPVRNIKQVEWDDSKVFVDLPAVTVQNSATFDPGEYIRPEDENTLHENYNIHFK